MAATRSQPQISAWQLRDRSPRSQYGTYAIPPSGGSLSMAATRSQPLISLRLLGPQCNHLGYSTIVRKPRMSFRDRGLALTSELERRSPIMALPTPHLRGVGSFLKYVYGQLTAQGASASRDQNVISHPPGGPSIRAATRS